MPEPKLSVVMLVGSQRERGSRALASVLAQAIVSDLEVLLLDFEPELQAVAGSAHPNVRRVEPERDLGYGKALALAVHLARAPIIAFVEEHVRVLPGFAEALLEAHRGPWAAVCGEMHPGDLGRTVAERIEMLSRHAFSVPARRGETTVLRWQNTSYKRDKLLAFGERLPLFLGSESALFRELRAQGDALFIENAAKLVHAHEADWRSFLTGSFHSARLSAASTVELEAGGSLGKLTAGAKCASGLLRWPWALWQRLGSLPDPETWLAAYRRHFPHVLEYYAVHAYAGALGALFGKGDSDREFLSYEINSRRLEPRDEP